MVLKYWVDVTSAAVVVANTVVVCTLRLGVTVVVMVEAHCCETRALH